VLPAAAACIAAAAILAPSAQAEFEFSAFGASTDIGGAFSRQAGAHPDLTTVAVFNGKEDPRDIYVDLPPGLVGNPTSTEYCTFKQLVARDRGVTPDCPLTSQVGEIRAYQTPALDDGSYKDYPLYNMVPPTGSAGQFAFNFAGAIVRIEPHVRSGDYGISADSTRIPEALPLRGVKVTFWGVPAEASHQEQRWWDFPAGRGGPNARSFAPRQPFMSSPTSCPAQATPFFGHADSWISPGVLTHAETTTDLTGTEFRWEGCQLLHFEPSMKVTPGTHRAASTTGLEFDIQVPQNEDPDGLATPHVRRVATTFPLGMTVSPSVVAGLGACSEAQVGLGNANPPTCPDSSKLGNVTIATPLLDERLRGEVVLAKQNENPFGSTYAVYLLAKGPGFYLKLPGELNVDKQTGQMKTVFDNLPQLPFEEAEFDFRGGPTAPFTTPDTCGTYRTHTELTSWSSPAPTVVDAPMAIDENCSGRGGFDPKLQAGVASPVAGAYSPLTIRIRREDGEQNISRFDVTLPQGEVANLKGVEVCPDAIAPTGHCPKGSQVGISTTAIGSGVFPLFIPQPGKDPTALYLAGAYKGSPYSLVAKVPAQSGPFDFGTIVVRTGINLNPVTAQVIAESDPLPQILEGVPIQYRDVRIEVQKPDFTINPTSCDQRHVTTTITSSTGTRAHPTVPTKVGDCGALSFGPKLAFKVSGGTNRGDFQALRATLTAGKHEANIDRVAVTLPHSEFLEQSHIGTVCTRVQFAQKKCPEASVYGTARAITPLLDQPLEGPVYLRSSNHSLPDLVAALKGQFDIELAGRIDSKNGGIRNTFELVPDAPVTKFVLKMKGGQKSLLVNSRNLCKSVSRADVKMVGQNGKRHSERPVVRNSCGKKTVKGKKGKRAAKRAARG
jgi:hypothetical protein